MRAADDIRLSAVSDLLGAWRQGCGRHGIRTVNDPSILEHHLRRGKSASLARRFVGARREGRIRARRADRFGLSHAMLNPQDFGARRDARHRHRKPPPAARSRWNSPMGSAPAERSIGSTGDELGIRFNEPLDILALINRTLVSQPVERRSMPRVELRCAVHIKYARALPAGDDAQHFGARPADRRRGTAACRDLYRACSSRG